MSYDSVVLNFIFSFIGMKPEAWSSKLLALFGNARWIRWCWWLRVFGSLVIITVHVCGYICQRFYWGLSARCYIAMLLCCYATLCCMIGHGHDGILALRVFSHALIYVMFKFTFWVLGLRVPWCMGQILL